MARPQALTITVDGARRVSGLLQVPGEARVCYVLAHGAGAGMSHPFMAAVASGLAQRGIATLRYQFPYMEADSKRPDTPNLAQATVRAAVIEASRFVPGLATVAGGKSFGGRMRHHKRKRNCPCRASGGLCSSDFRFIPPGNHQMSVQITCSR
jgi:predicted alpha/beta-hydrolase family hydrolase